MFAFCTSLQKLDLNDWDTSEWPVASIGNVFYNCQSLKELHVDEWTTDDWVVTTINYMFTSCTNLEELDLSTWKVDKWRPTNLQYVFQGMNSLRILDLTTWDVSKWNPTSIAGCFTNMLSLQKLDLHTWDTSGWTSLTSISQAFQRINAREIYLPSKFLFNSTYSSSNAYYFNMSTLMKFNGFGYYINNHSYSECRLLDHESLINILNELQTVTASRTITLGATNKNKLTTAEIAIATAKGWTVA